MSSDLSISFITMSYIHPLSQNSDWLNPCGYNKHEFGGTWAEVEIFPYPPGHPYLVCPICNQIKGYTPHIQSNTISHSNIQPVPLITPGTASNISSTSASQSYIQSPIMSGNSYPSYSTIPPVSSYLNSTISQSGVYSQPISCYTASYPTTPGLPQSGLHNLHYSIPSHNFH
jgi:hypothetical protein